MGDLTTKIAALLDRHMVYPILEFLAHVKAYPEKQILQAKYDLLKNTNMLDLANTVYQQLNATDANSPECEAKRPNVLASYERLQSSTEKLLSILEDPAALALLKESSGDKAVMRAHLAASFGFQDDMLDALYDYAQCQFQIGSYQGAADLLFHYRVLSSNSEKCNSALWGKLACEILLEKWDIALDELLKLKDVIDTPATTPSTVAAVQILGESESTGATTAATANLPSNTQQLIQRSFFIAWSLFVYFNHPKGRDALIETFMQPAYISAIQTTCPWALRYLTACIITTRNRRKNQLLKELVKLVASERELQNSRKSAVESGQEQLQSQQQDPLTGFIYTLYSEYNFSEAHKSLALCKPVLQRDYFLASMEKEFLETARTMVFESYVKVYREIDIGVLSATLGLSRDEGEKWVVDLVRGVRMDAKIDSENNTVIMGAQYTSVFQNVIERTRNLTFRTNLLASNIEKREVELANRRAGTTEGKKESKKSSGGSGGGGGGVRAKY
ncbi:Eukaryotic translation initiation factor 3 subunit E [Physocladia obscura]|uniref:Eukaryotic translation initiation factor 3 subunit E n=1 Tax=Physocladia obscura TaxID=109957 RepID=A0AAD5T0K6_9FUNG|nr:Eukaryotic translation initiation factor 3 subunit E [Physocladia obscura]